MTNTPRTVSVNVLVSAPLEIDEPSWCTGDHPGHNFMQDITHNGSEVSARFETRHGPVDYLTAYITQAPYGEVLPEPYPRVAVEIAGDTRSLEPADVRSFTALTRAHLDILDRVADECERLRNLAGGEDR
ncbi:DUF6907 domain-containing protein [Streptomyces sp. NPDC088847]|uniref:DUF6907 domain-containing protein n=1 Tax=Streptomyces sp. NPDC088847 TaxID=3365909 RepID=UPI0038226592